MIRAIDDVKQVVTIASVIAGGVPTADRPPIDHVNETVPDR
ncbi:hypothetical protein [Cellulomonas dongxiuzhuiae]|nr:hypothetical protein [Cellulomonas dongxiuzhuiae]